MAVSYRPLTAGKAQDSYARPKSYKRNQHVTKSRLTARSGKVNWLWVTGTKENVPWNFWSHDYWA
jgi:hypothetical protein